MITLFDGPEHDALLPLTFTRPVCETLIGIGTIRQKWARLSNSEVQVMARDYLRELFPIASITGDLLINGSLLPDRDLLDFLMTLPPGRVIYHQGVLLAVSGADFSNFSPKNELLNSEKFESISLPGNIPIVKINQVWDFYLLNSQVLEFDFDLMTRGRESVPIDASNRLIGDRIFMEAGASVSASTINSTSGPVYLAAGAEIQEGALIRGGLYLGAGATIKMGAKLYGASSFGSSCKIGGEVTNSIIHDNSNKAHDGYLGNSIIGSWCNFGADTNSSNLKNNYGEISIHTHPEGSKIDTGQQFLGMIMGDHSKCGINTMFNTGTTVGVSCNIFGTGFPPTFIPSFSWGGADHLESYRIDKAIETARRVMSRRHLVLSTEEESLMRYIYFWTAKYRQK